MNDKNKPPEDQGPAPLFPNQPGSERKPFDINNPFGMKDPGADFSSPFDEKQVTSSRVPAAGLNKFNLTSHFQQFGTPEKPEEKQEPELPTNDWMSAYLKMLSNDTKENKKGDDVK